MAFKRNLLQEKFRRLTLNQFRELMSEIRQGVPGKYEEYENPGCSSRIQKWTLSNSAALGIEIIFQSCFLKVIASISP